MDKIYVKIDKLNDYAKRISDVKNRSSELEDRLNYFVNIGNDFNLTGLKTNGSLTIFSRKLQNCQMYLQQTADDFKTIENNISSRDPKSFSQKFDLSMFSSSLQENDILSDYQKKLQRLLRSSIEIGMIAVGESETGIPLSWESFWNGDMEYIEGNTTWSLIPKYGEVEEKLLKKLKKNKKTSDKDKKWYEQTTKKWKDNLPEEEFYEDPKVTIIEAEVEEKKEYSALSDSTSAFLYAEAHKNAALGLYVYAKDGKKFFSPGISAEVGASASVVHFESGEGRVGLGKNKDMLGLYGELDYDVLSVEGKAKFSVNFDEVYAGGGIEVNAIELEATGGISVLGADIDLSGSLKVGLGAHAEVGLTDGKFKVDLGASFGIGFDIGFEVDVSGAVDAVVGVAEDVWEGTTDFISDVGDGISDFVSDVGDGISDFFSGWF